MATPLPPVDRCHTQQARDRAFAGADPWIGGRQRRSGDGGAGSVSSPTAAGSAPPTGAPVGALAGQRVRIRTQLPLGIDPLGPLERSHGDVDGHPDHARVREEPDREQDGHGSAEQAEEQQRRIRVGGHGPAEDDADHQHLGQADVEEPRAQPLPRHPLERQPAAGAVVDHDDPPPEQPVLPAHRTAAAKPPPQQRPGRQAHDLIVTDPTVLSTVERSSAPAPTGRPTTHGRDGGDALRSLGQGPMALGGWCQTKAASERRLHPATLRPRMSPFRSPGVSNPASSPGGRLAALPSTPFNTNT